MTASLEWLGYSAGLLTTLAFLPQVYKTWQRKSAQDISYGMYALFSVGLVLWTAYGFFKQALPIVMANCVTLLLALTILILKFHYEHRNK
ncbi:MAG: SemiSWEET transporter [Gammaproteobacteria bacterium]|nr:SemiSWEET transporter [Gammaproteobacteria bacterium]